MLLLQVLFGTQNFPKNSKKILTLLKFFGNFLIFLKDSVDQFYLWPWNSEEVWARYSNEKSRSTGRMCSILCLFGGQRFFFSVWSSHSCQWWYDRSQLNSLIQYNCIYLSPNKCFERILFVYTWALPRNK